MFSNKELKALNAILPETISTIRKKLELAEESLERNKNEAKLITLVSTLNKIKIQLKKHGNDQQKQSMPKILIVDDSESMLGVASALLGEMGFTKIEKSESAEKALATLLNAAENKTPFELVLTDWEMSGKTGLDLLKDIRTNEKLLETAVYMMTSHSEQGHILKAIEYGVTGYLLKPLNFKMLNGKLKDFLPSAE
ncbi:chemotaxis protein [Pseudoalteromonas luteoviolacea B = ATCC 29581]|nr:chemotaxis protein [Pseudoalteromonas luteoviolacea B = ATCC 29581]